VIPSIFLSGYVFPVESMPTFFQYVARMVPTTWMIDASRGVILRGASWLELKTHFAVLLLMSVALIGVAVMQFQKRLS
jgi:ABC-2 type transport system permease protein